MRRWYHRGTIPPGVLRRGRNVVRRVHGRHCLPAETAKGFTPSGFHANAPGAAEPALLHYTGYGHWRLRFNERTVVAETGFPLGVWSASTVRVDLHAGENTVELQHSGNRVHADPGALAAVPVAPRLSMEAQE